MVVAVVAATAAWAVPQWRASVDEARAWGWQRELIDGLERARAHVRVHGEPVTLCGGTPERGCTPDGWSAGWLLVRGDPRDAADGGTPAVLAQGRGAGPRHTVRVSAFLAGGVHFEPGQWSAASGTLTLCRDGRIAAEVVVAITGRPRPGDARGAPCE